MSVLLIHCTACRETNSIYKRAYNASKYSGLGYPCPSCRAADLTKTGEIVNSKVKGPTVQKRSKDQEKRAARRYGGSRTAASGALDEKGDVRVHGVMRIECKYTAAKSFTLKREELEKIEKEAIAAGEMPVFEIEFQNHHPKRRFVVLREEDFDELNRKSKAYIGG